MVTVSTSLIFFLEQLCSFRCCVFHFHKFLDLILVLVQPSVTTMPKPKFPPKRAPDTSDSDSGPDDRGPAKKAKTPTGSRPGGGGASRGNPAVEGQEPKWELGNNKRVTVRLISFQHCNALVPSISTFGSIEEVIFRKSS